MTMPEDTGMRVGRGRGRRTADVYAFFFPYCPHSFGGVRIVYGTYRVLRGGSGTGCGMLLALGNGRGECTGLLCGRCSSLGAVAFNKLLSCRRICRGCGGVSYLVFPSGLRA